MKREVKYIVVHCTATPPETSIESIQRYWREVKGWKDVPGYHYLIKADGQTIKLLDETKNSYGVYAHNSECISISYIGGIDKNGKPKDTRSRRQEVAMFNKIMDVLARYPKATVLGHRDFPGVKKACPCFDVKKWLLAYKPDVDLTT